MISPETTQILLHWSWAPNLLLQTLCPMVFPISLNTHFILPWLGSPLTPVFICPHRYVPMSPVSSTFRIDQKHLKYAYFPPYPPLQCGSRPPPTPNWSIAQHLSWRPGFCSHPSSQNGLGKIRSCHSSAPAPQWFLPDSEFKPKFVGWPIEFVSTLSLRPDTWDSISPPYVSPFGSGPTSGMALSQSVCTRYDL